MKQKILVICAVVVAVAMVAHYTGAAYLLADQVLSSVYNTRKQLQVTTASGADPTVTGLVESTNLTATTRRVELTNAIRYDYFSLHMEGSGGVTFTVWYTLNEDADTTADTDWVDVTNDLCGSASIVDDEAVCVQNAKLRGRYMVKYVTSDATNAVDIFYLPF